MKTSLISLLLLLPCASSCVVVAAAGAGAAATYGLVSYKNNAASRDFHHNADKVWKVSLQALKAQDYVIEGVPLLHGEEGVIEAGEASVTVERVSRNSSNVSVRVGTFDSDANRRAAKLILEEIARRLGE